MDSVMRCLPFTRPLLLLAVLLLSFSSLVQGQVTIQPGTSTQLDGRLGNINTRRRNLLQPAVPLLSVAPDSRSAGMGDVGAASTPDVNSQHWNVAKYALIPDRWGLGFSYIPWMPQLVRGEISLMYLAGYYRIGEMQAISMSLRYFSLGQMIFTNEQGQELMRHNPHEFAIDVGYSRKFMENLSGGIAFRFIRSDLSGGFTQQNAVGSTKAGMSYAADLGIYYNLPLRLGHQDGEWALGFSITNIGSKLSYNNITKQFIPITMRIGTRFTYHIDEFNTISALLDASKLMIPTPPIYDQNHNILKGRDPNVPVVTGMFLSFADAPGGSLEEFREVYWAFGAEYLYAKQFAVRTGFFYEHEYKGGRKYFTLGAGFNYNVLSLDVAYLIPTAGFRSPMAHTVRFSLAVNLAPKGRQQTAIQKFEETE